MESLKKSMEVHGKKYSYFSLKVFSKENNVPLDPLPYSLKILLENLIRNLDGQFVTENDLRILSQWRKDHVPQREINFFPSRVVMQDLTGVPAVVDLAVMRDVVLKTGGMPGLINPLIPVDLVIDHSVMVDFFGSRDSFQKNVAKEFERNYERYRFLKWGQKAFKNFRVVPPGTGIIHQVNLEYLARVVWTREHGQELIAYPDTLVGTDSHTTMINALSVLGWGVGGIEAEAAMLGQPISLLIPEVVGFELTGSLGEGTTATDLVLTITQILRSHGVVGRFVEFFGPGLDHLSLADRATISNMAPEYGATCGIFPIDQEVVHYLGFTGRDKSLTELVEIYAKEQGLWRDKSWKPEFNQTLGLDLGEVKPSISGPIRPQDKVLLRDASVSFEKALKEIYQEDATDKEIPVEGEDYSLHHGDVVIAAITSCTNTSNPGVLIAAGLLAKKAREKGLTSKPWVKTSLAPGSKVVTEYLEKSGLSHYLDELGFQLVGYGCTTCIGNSGPLPERIRRAIKEGNLITCNVLSGNRNFEGRISPDSRASFLASPPLVVAYALIGTIRKDLLREPIAKDKYGKDVFLKDIWPSNSEIKEWVEKSLDPEMFKTRYSDVFSGTPEWQEISTPLREIYDWDEKSTYIKSPPFFTHFNPEPPSISDIKGARCLAVFPDSTTTDHISPAGVIPMDGPAGTYLISQGVDPLSFNSFGSRRGNHEVMMRGTFANIRIKNKMLPGIEGGYTKYNNQEVMSIYDAAMKYSEQDIPLIVFAGKEYGTGSSRDWAAKGPFLLGVKAVIARSYERIHRSNLVGMGILPLELLPGTQWGSFDLAGDEVFDIIGIKDLKTRGTVVLNFFRDREKIHSLTLKARIDTESELNYFCHKGILAYVLRQLLKGLKS